VKVRIVRNPEAGVEAIDFEGLHKGFVYELASDFAMLLICEGYAEIVEGIFGRRAHAHAHSTSNSLPTSTVRMQDRRRRAMF
jgi:hypothetical protein